METKEITRAVVGMPATIRIGSDRYAARVVKVGPSGNVIDVAYDRDGEVRRYFWVAARQVWKSGSFRLELGVAVTDLDPCF